MQTVSTEQIETRSNIVSSMKRRPVVWFFSITFAFTWIYEFLVFGVFHLPTFWIVPATFGPAFSAVFLSAMISGRQGVRALLRRCLLWRVGWQWYLVAFCLIPLLTLLSAFIIPEAREALQMPAGMAFLNYIPLLLLTMLIGGPLGEEIGWRGFALPHLQQRFGPVIGTIILGALWGLWHLPLFLFVPGYNGTGSDTGAMLLSFLIFIAFCLAVSFLFTWVLNGTQASLLLVILLHAVNNTGPAALFMEAIPTHISDGMLKNIFISALAVVAILLIVVTHGKLGFKRVEAGINPSNSTDSVNS